MHKPIVFSVNGQSVSSSAASQRLSDTLRDELGLTGTKIGCNAGDCGACTVLLDGQQVCACLTATGQCAGREVSTVEGLAIDGRLNVLQQTFHLHGAAQCGICTPGMLMAATDVLRRHPLAWKNLVPIWRRLIVFGCALSARPLRGRVLRWAIWWRSDIAIRQSSRYLRPPMSLKIAFRFSLIPKINQCWPSLRCACAVKR